MHPNLNTTANIKEHEKNKLVKQKIDSTKF